MARLRVPGRAAQVEPDQPSASKPVDREESEAVDVLPKAKAAKAESGHLGEDSHKLRRSSRMIRRTTRALAVPSTKESSRSTVSTGLPQQNNERVGKASVKSKRARRSDTANRQTNSASRATTPKGKAKPRYQAPEQEPETMEHLNTYIKPFVDPDTFATYSNLVSTLKRRGPKSPPAREQLRKELEVLIREDEGLLGLHNEATRMQNQRNEAYHERFSLPQFEDVEVSGSGRESRTGSEQIDANEQSPSAEETKDAIPASEEDGVDGDGSTGIRNHRNVSVSQLLGENELSDEGMQDIEDDIATANHAVHSPADDDAPLTNREALGRPNITFVPATARKRTPRTVPSSTRTNATAVRTAATTRPSPYNCALILYFPLPDGAILPRLAEPAPSPLPHCATCPC